MANPVAGRLGSAERPLRVAVVGAGPAGLYTAEFLLKADASAAALTAEVDLFDRLPSPFGLVRSGVAPDHQGIKKVTKAFERILAHERLRFYGNVGLGQGLAHTDLMQHYDAVVYSTGAATDRRLGVAGEDLAGSHAATALVGWYNGHPDFINEHFDLSARTAVIVGLGNVAMDVARVLIRDPEELKDTDIADYALAALRSSQIREVILLGRRGPAEAAFTPREIQDIAELPGVQVSVDPGGEVEPGAELKGTARQIVEFVRQAAEEPRDPNKKQVRLRFLTSPVELHARDARVKAVRVERNRLEISGDRVRAVGTGEYEDLPAQLVFRSIGYYGTPLPGLPFDERAGVIPNQQGRVCESPGSSVLPGVYTCGWIKRGPSGLIGTNKSDAKETSAMIVEDALAVGTPRSLPARDALPALLSERGIRVVTLADWQRLDALERSRGEQQGKVREKFYTVQAMLDALGA